MLTGSLQRGEVAAPGAGRDRAQVLTESLPKQEEPSSAVEYFCVVLHIW